MQSIEFQKANGDINIQPIFEGVMVAAYKLSVYDLNDTEILTVTKDNIETSTDSSIVETITLPVNDLNDEKYRLQFLSNFKGLDVENLKPYNIYVTFKQNGESIGGLYAESGNLTGATQTILKNILLSQTIG